MGSTFRIGTLTWPARASSGQLVTGPLYTGFANTGQPLFAQPTTAGSLLVAVGTYSNTVPPTACGDITWTKAVEENSNSTGGASFIFYKPNCAAGETAPTFTASAGATPLWAMCLVEVLGDTVAAPLDRTAAGFTPGGLTATATATLTDGAGDIVFMAGEWINYASYTGVTDSFNNGTIVALHPQTSLSGFEHFYSLLYSLPTGNASPDSWTETITGTGSGGGALALASFKLH